MVGHDRGILGANVILGMNFKSDLALRSPGAVVSNTKPIRIGCVCEQSQYLEYEEFQGGFNVFLLAIAAQ